MDRNQVTPEAALRVAIEYALPGFCSALCGPGNEHETLGTEWHAPQCRRVREALAAAAASGPSEGTLPSTGAVDSPRPEPMGSPEGARPTPSQQRQPPPIVTASKSTHNLCEPRGPLCWRPTCRNVALPDRDCCAEHEWHECWAFGEPHCCVPRNPAADHIVDANKMVPEPDAVAEALMEARKAVIEENFDVATAALVRAVEALDGRTR